MFRRLFVSATDVAGGTGKPDNYYVASVLAAEIRALNLSVIPDPQPSMLPGHALIPELSVHEYKANRQRLREAQIQLCDSRVEGHRVHAW